MCPPRCLLGCVCSDLGVRTRTTPTTPALSLSPPYAAVLDGSVLLLESSEELISSREFGRIVRSLGERGVLAAVDAVVVARPPTTNSEVQPTTAERAALRARQRDVAIASIDDYNSNAVVVVGVPFGHTRPQWILPYGGQLIVDGQRQQIWADYA